MKNKYLKKLILFSVMLTLSALLVACGNKNENIELGFNALQEKEYDKAIDYFETALTKKENPRLALRGEGLTYMAIGDYTSAKDAFLSAIKEGSGSPDAYDFDINYYYAATCYKNGDFEEAKSVYDAILGIKKKEKDAYYMRGACKLQLSDIDGATEDFNHVISFDKNDYTMYIKVYQLMNESGYAEQGKVYLQTAIDGGKNLSNEMRGEILYYIQDYPNARNYLKQAGEKTLTENVAFFWGKTCEELGDYEYAKNLYEQYLSDNPNSVRIIGQLAVCCMSPVIADYETALSNLSYGIEIIRGDETLYDEGMLKTLRFNEIVALEYLGKFKEAAVEAEKYIKDYPTDTDAIHEYEFLRTR